MIPRGSMSKIPFNQVSLMSTILDIPFVCVKRVGTAMAQTKTCKSWLLPQRCGNFEKVATTAVPGGKKVAPPFFFYAPSLYVNTNRKTPVAYKIKSCHRVVATFGFRKNGLGFRKNHFGSVSKGFAQQWHSLKLVNPDAFLMPQSIRIYKF